MEQPDNHLKLGKETDKKFPMMKHRYRTFEKRRTLYEELYEQGRFPLYYYLDAIIFTVAVVPLVVYWIIYRDSQSFIDLVMLYQAAFEKYDVVGIFVALLLGSTYFLFFPSFCLWTSLRSSTAKKGTCDFSFLCLYLVFLTLFFTLPPLCIIFFDLPLFSATAVIIVQLWQFAKIYSYTRECVPKVLESEKLRKDVKENELWRPSVISFFSFMIAPSLIYSDTYPRTFPSVKKMCLYYTGTICSMILFPMSMAFWYKAIFKRFGECSFFSMEHLLYTTFICTTYCATSAITMGYGAFHCAFNYWSELTLFGDRLFCKEWWKCGTFMEIARTWSFPIHQFFHTYVYVDFYNVFVRDKYKAAIFTFFVSALMHDYIFSIVLRSIVPPLLCSLIICLILCPHIFINKKGKSFSWFVGIRIAVASTSCLFINGYLLFAEFSAMHRCPQTPNSWWKYLYPRFMQC